METHDKEMEDAKKNQKDMLELKNKMTEINISVHQPNCKMDTGILIELKDRVIEVTNWKTERNRVWKKRKKESSRMCGAIPRALTFMTLDSQKETE